MQSNNSREIDFSRFSTLKAFTGSIIDQAIKAVSAGVVSFDLSRDYYTRGELMEKLYKIQNCSSLLELREYEDGEKTIHNANFCKTPIACSCCSDRVSRRRKAVWKPKIDQAAKKYSYVYFVTMTIKDRPDLEDRIETLINGKKRFRKMGQTRKAGKSGGEWSKVQAAISNTEIKYGSGGAGAHVHEHALLFCDERLDYSIYDQDKMNQLQGQYGRGQVPKGLLDSAVKDWYFTEQGEPVPVSKLSAEWIEATAGEGISIDVKYLSFADYSKNPFYKGYYCSSFSEWVTNQASEILKYNSKLAEDQLKNPVTPGQLVELIQRRGSRRLFNSYGAFRRRGDPLYFSSTDQKWLEYVERRDKKTYEIRPAKYDGKSWRIGRPVNEAIFSDSDRPDRCKRARLSEQGKIVGRYRRGRSAVLFRRRSISAALLPKWRHDAENELLRIREEMRQSLRVLWNTKTGFEDDNDYQDPGDLVKPGRPRVRSSYECYPVQLSLF